MTNLLSVAGKTALITGASGGLGAHFARVLADHGATVVVAARRTEKLEAVVKEITEAGGTAYAIPLDVSNTESVNAAFEQLDQRVGTLDILVNNAGVNGSLDKLVDTQEDDWNFVMETNVNGVYRVAQAAAKRMAEAGSGSIINIGSILGIAPGVKKAAYCASKAAVHHLTRCMAVELVRNKVRVNSLCPGWFYTDINAAQFDTDSGKAYIRRLVPQRLGENSELDGALMLLASDAGSYITGQEIVVDGGTTLTPQ